MDWYPWIVLLHVLGAFGFALAHGASAFAAIQIRSERDPARVAALLDMSGMSLGLMYGSLLILLIGGITAGFMGGFWGSLWIWVAIGVLVLVIGAMYPLGSTHYANVRRAVGLKAYNDPKDTPPSEPLPPAELEQLLSSNRPFVLAAVGGIGLVVIIWLMVVKPF
jgi:MFS family permease